jgi:hypothetical protein
VKRRGKPLIIMANLSHAEENHLYSFQGDAFDGFETDYNTEYLSSNFDRVSPSADQVYVPYLDIDTKWRSISIAHPSPALFRAHGSAADGLKRGLVDRVDHVKSHPKKHVNAIEIITSGRLNDFGSKSSNFVSNNKAPSQPFLLMPTHFGTKASLEVIMLSIRDVLSDFPEISFECVAEECSVSKSTLTLRVACASVISSDNFINRFDHSSQQLQPTTVECRLPKRIDALQATD